MYWHFHLRIRRPLVLMFMPVDTITTELGTVTMPKWHHAELKINEHGYSVAKEYSIRIIYEGMDVWSWIPHVRQKSTKVKLHRRRNNYKNKQIHFKVLLWCYFLSIPWIRCQCSMRVGAYFKNVIFVDPENYLWLIFLLLICKWRCIKFVSRVLSNWL